MAEKKAIHEFATGQGHFNSLLLMDNPDPLASSGYTTENLPISDLGILIGTLVYQQRLDTNVKTVFGGINELFARVMNIASDYDENETYNTDDLCFYQNVLYKCNDDMVTGVWDATKWDATTIADELANSGGGGSGGYPVLYGTADPTSAQGSNGQLYAKYAHIAGCEVEITIYKPTDARTVSITITENSETVYTATPACSLYGEYSEVSTTITLSTGTYTLKHWGEEVQTPNTESQFVEINGITVGFAHNGSNSSYTVDGSEEVEVSYGGTAVVAVWLKMSNTWIPFMLSSSGGASWKDVTGTLTAGSTSITLSDASISSSSTVDVYTDTFGVNPTNVVVSTGSVTLTFAAQQSDVEVKVRIS